MSRVSPKVALWIAAALALASLAIAFVFGGKTGLLGMLLGLTGATFGCMAMVLLVQWLGAYVSTGGRFQFGTLVILGAAAAKIPVLYGLWLFAGKIGGPAPTCFLVGLVLVYFAFVAWASTR